MTQGAYRQNSASVGRVVENTFRDLDLRSLSDEIVEQGFEFMCYYIGGEKRCTLDPSDPQLTLESIPPITVVDMQFRAADWSRFIVGRLSPWIDLDSPDKRLRELSEKAFDQEIDYMRYLGLNAIMIPLTRPWSPMLSRQLSKRLWATPGHNFAIWIVVPLTAPPKPDEIDDNDWEEDTWMWWYRFRKQCATHRKVTVCLKIGSDLPGQTGSRDLRLMRWKAEPVASIWLDTSLFLTNAGGWPVLSRPHQSLIKMLFIMAGPAGGSAGCQVIMSGSINHPQALSPGVYRDYINHLWQNRPGPNAVDKFAAGYEDHLQVPLQPLADDLESGTYEVFEKDPVKYEKYKEAIVRALRDLCEARAEGSTEPLVVMVLGAGRGPLVGACFGARAELDTQPPFRIFAVEKNPNAIITLNRMNETSWKGEVTVVHSDMRQFHPELKADLVVSELLGSFGDNELSPECLDGAQHLMKDTCISIPTSYTSYLAPVSSTKLYCSIRDDMGATSEILSARGVCNQSRNPTAAQVLSEEGVSDVFDIPYVVRLHNRYEMCAPKSLFTFQHPSFGPTDNNRVGELTFQVQIASELMGFAGYFECVLYKSVTLSTVPRAHTPDLISWFPILFPVPEPVLVDPNDKIRIHISRIVQDDKVWYQWSLLEPVISRIQNACGSAYSMKM